MARRLGNFLPEFVVGILDQFNSDESEEVKWELQRKGFGDYPFCLSMNWCSKSLLVNDLLIG